VIARSAVQLFRLPDRRVWRVAVSLWAAAAAFGWFAGPAGSAPLAGPRVTRATLSNGLHVVIVEEHAAPLAVVSIYYRYGTNDEPRDRAGLAHALEHMMFRGTRGISASASVDLDAQVGARANAATGRGHTRFQRILPADRVDVALRLEADRMRGLLLNEHDWHAERPVVLAELRERLANPFLLVRDAVRTRAYGGTSFAHAAGGTLASVQQLSARDLRHAYDDAYTPDNATLVVTGDVRPAMLLPLVRRLFGPLRGRARTAQSDADTPVHRGFTVRMRAAGPNVVDIALESHANNEAAGAVESVAAELIGDDHPALGDPLDGPCASYAINDDTDAGGGLFHIVCRQRWRSEPQRVVRIVHDRLLELAAHPPHAQIARAKRAIIDASASPLDDLAAEAAMFGGSYADTDRDPRADDAIIARVTDLQVAAVLRRWAVPLGIGIVGSITRGSVHVDDAPRRHVLLNARTRPDEPLRRPSWAEAASRAPLHVSALPAPALTAFALPNGVRAFVQRTAPHGRIYLRAGFDDPDTFGAPLELGVGRLAEYLLAYGSRNWTEARRNRVAEERGMTIYVAAEISAEGHARDLPVMLDILSDAWRRPAIGSNDVMSGKFGLFEHFLHVNGDPDATTTAALARQLYRPKTSIVVPLRRALASRPADVLRFLHEHVRPDRAWIAITGDVDPDSARALIVRALASWSAAGAAADDSHPIAPAHPIDYMVSVERPSVRVFLAQPAPRRADPDFSAMQLLVAVLGGPGLDSRLMRELRLRRSLVYGAYGFLGTPVDGAQNDGTLLISFECAPHDVATASTVVRSVLRGLVARPPSEDELERARRALIVDAMRDATSPDGILDRLELAARTHAAPENADDVLRRLSAVSAGDVARAARTYLKPEQLIQIENARFR
jgi:zinc protease